jgi:hypothetical protein
LQGREPAGYIEALKQKDPEIIFDASKLHTKEDWIEAGKLVFGSDTRLFPARALTADDIPFATSTISKDGMLPGFGSVITYARRARSSWEQTPAPAATRVRCRTAPSGGARRAFILRHDR